MQYLLDTPTHLNGKPETCHWCGGRFERLRHIYKGKDSHRYYDSEKCLIRGEQRAADLEITRVAQLAGQVHSRWYVGVAGILALFILVFATTPKARAQGHDEGHAKYHDNAYSTWMKPDKPGESCCNMKVMSEDGKYRVKGDCYPTEAILKPDPETHDLNWWALRDDGKWIPIPDIKVLRRTPNPDESGRSSHLCESYGTIHCFREPSGVM